MRSGGPVRRSHPGSFPDMRLPMLRNLLREVILPAPMTPYATYPRNLPRPEVIHPTVLYRDDRVAVVNDAYPKSTVHCLVLPIDASLQSLNDLTRDAHLSLLEHMKYVADGYMDHLHRMQTFRRHRMICGFHAIPSLPQLHMHLLTLDFQSNRLRKVAHYNGFTTPFFLSPGDVIDDLSKHGRVTLNQDVDRLTALENGPLKCLWCGEGDFHRVGALKQHLSRCPKNGALVDDPTHGC